MSNLKLILPLLVFFTFSFFGKAQIEQTSLEKVEFRSQYAALEKDKAEWKDFQYKITRLEAALMDNDSETMEVIKSQLVEAMEREISQGENTNTQVATMQKRRKILDEIKDFDFVSGISNIEKTKTYLILLNDFSKIMEADVLATSTKLDEMRMKVLDGKKTNNGSFH